MAKTGLYKLHTQCRACGSTGLKKVFDLGVQPLANDFCLPTDPQGGYAPLQVMLCPSCSLAQLSVVVDPKTLYSYYNYVTSNSRTMLEHFSTICGDIGKEATGSIVEIGSNDGLFLEFAKGLGFGPCMAVDPAINLRPLAINKSLSTIQSLFNRQSASLILEWNKKIDIVVARHVFCHVDDWKEFMDNLERISNKDTLICIEAPYVVDTLENLEFDQIYHEHLSFMNIKAMACLLEGTNFHLHNVIHYPIHGGSVMVMLRRNDSEIAPSGSVDRFLEKENITVATWAEFSIRCQHQIGRLHGLVEDLVRQGKSVVGCCASAKSTVWINACGIGQWLRFITDNTPQKIGKFSPGTTIPIVDEKHLVDEQPDYAILFGWNFKNELIEKHKDYRDRGGKFIVPVPEIEVI